MDFCSLQVAVDFCVQMFGVRGYNAANMRLSREPSSDTLQLTATNAKHKPFLCIFWRSERKLDTGVNIQNVNARFGSVGDGANPSLSRTPPLLVLPKKIKNLGTDFLVALLAYKKAHQVKHFIVVTDFVTSYAKQKIKQNQSIRIEHFHYREVMLLNLGSHVYQPLSCRILTAAEKAAYVAANPRYGLECFRFPHTDRMIKYFGCLIGDIVVSETVDGVSGVCREYGLVVNEDFV